MIKTITLSGGEVAVALDGAHAHIRNDGTDVIYAAKTAGITPGADGVASIPAGQADTIRGISGIVYLLGTGSVHIQSDDYVANPFKTSTVFGGSAVDEQARTAVSTHAGNAEIHVTARDKENWNMSVAFVTFNSHVSNSTMHTTAEEKAAWNAKADLSDIPTELPANGGNADTLDGFHETSFSRNRGNISDCDIAVLPGTYNATPDTANTPYSEYWLVTVETGSNGSWIRQTATICDRINPNETYRRLFINDKWSDSWAKVNDGGNAAMLESHPASDFVLKTDYDALAARVAALEAK